MKALKCSTSVKRVNVCARPRSDKRGRWWWWSTCRTDGCTGEGTIRSDRQADTATVRPSERQRRSAARRAVQSSFSKADQERERERQGRRKFARPTTAPPRTDAQRTSVLLFHLLLQCRPPPSPLSSLPPAPESPFGIYSRFDFMEAFYCCAAAAAAAEE